MKEFSREYIQSRKEDIFDLIQNLTDVVRYADREPDAPNSNFYNDYLKYAVSAWNRIFK